MKQFITIGLLYIIAITAAAQMPVKYDNLYKKIYPAALCRFAQEHPNLVLIDVRSPGEFRDTSQYNSLNIGHLKSAINIPVDSIQKNIAVLNPYKNNTIVFYCSHSQRSRRVSKLASENGFTDFYNLNGGMSYINEMDGKALPCKKDWLQSSLLYKNIATEEAIQLMKNEAGLVIIDVRPAAMFNSADSLLQNNIGHIKKAVNIPYDVKTVSVEKFAAYRNQPILVYAESGNGDAARTSLLLSNNGFSNVHNMVSGYNELLLTGQGRQMVDNPPAFRLVDGIGVLELLQTKKALTIYDTRPKIEFGNKVTGYESYKNMGNLKGAINLEEKDFGTWSFPMNKNEPVLICGREEAFKLADILHQKGFSNVYLLFGLYDLVYTAFNVEGKTALLQYLQNHDDIY